MAHYLPWVSFIFGLWLLIAPYTLGFTEHSPAMWNSFVIGALSALAGIMTVYEQWHHPAAHKA